MNLQMPKNATSAERWIIICLFDSDFNKKQAAWIAGVQLRRVQQVAKKHRDILVTHKNETCVRSQ